MSPISGAMGAAQAGMARGAQRMQDAAQALTRDITPEAAVEMKIAQAEVAASAKVAVIADRSLGQLIDTLA